ncbi:eukaryotic peptide chain release factor GTP-binding subunit ERF3A-like [Clavelina lepadiformis]|uniref:eukaryotic peptide chain release factor GTP-binding subunit ERF3A-like n=1 Tax=Clavelina lepadiformis TaxID=159417 RepID=UPI004042BF9D
MNGQNIPDSWDSGLDGSEVENATSTFSQLNIGAKPFVPNVHAAAFVPSFKTAACASPPQDSASPVQESFSPPASSDEGDKVLMNSHQVDKEADQQNAPESEMETEVNDQEVQEKEVEEMQIEAQPSAIKIAPVEARQSSRATPPPPPVETDEEEGKMKEDHLNVVFIGHVDAGKSTIGGQIMYLTGMVDKRTLEKYEREAKEKNRETWYLSWALDTNQEERDKGKTVEVGRAYFETETKHFTILDAPGHRSFVPNMIGGASQADVAVLVISARRGEFETGFERGGQTREHAMLAKTAGVQHLVVLINKMDDPTVKWNKVRYDECKEKLTPFLKKVGFNPKKDIHFMPCSGLAGTNLKESDFSKHPWYTDLPLIPYLDNLPTVSRSGTGPVRLPIVDKYKDMGVIVLGKIESGRIFKGQSLILQPNKRKVKVLGILSDDEETDSSIAGENVKIRLDSVEEEEISKGFVLCSPDNLCSTGTTFDAQIAIIEYKSIICAGYSAILHIHTCVEEVVIKQLICLIDRKTGEKKKTRFVKQDQTVIARMQTQGSICIESFKKFPQMGRFTLRDEGRTIAIGKVLKLLD